MNYKYMTRKTIKFEYQATEMMCSSQSSSVVWLRASSHRKKNQ